MILGIESSCDESALALFDPGVGMLGEWVHTQIELHREYGGVVPDLASREHLTNFPEVLEAAGLRERLGDLTQVAVTVGPGLAACLAMGIAVAKAIHCATGVPLIPVNHLRGHAFSPFIPVHADDPVSFPAAMRGLLPHLGLIVSGGNTLLFSLDEQRTIRILAETVDDAAGEALDKGAKLLGLPYPGGPEVERHARNGNPEAFDFPRAIAPRNRDRFSFSGLKTSIRYRIEELGDAATAAAIDDLCASYQAAVIGQLVGKTRHLLARRGPRWRSLGLSGGVANNSALRDACGELAERHRLPLLCAERRHTGDNAAMIAFAASVDPLAKPVPMAGVAFEPSAPLAE